MSEYLVLFVRDYGTLIFPRHLNLMILIISCKRKKKLPMISTGHVSSSLSSEIMLVPFESTIRKNQL